MTNFFTQNGLPLLFAAAASAIQSYGLYAGLHFATPRPADGRLAIILRIVRS